MGRAEQRARDGEKVDAAPTPKQTSVKSMRPEARRLHEQFVQLIGSDAAEAAEAALLLREVCTCTLCARARARVCVCVNWAWLMVAAQSADKLAALAGGGVAAEAPCTLESAIKEMDDRIGQLTETLTRPTSPPPAPHAAPLAAVRVDSAEEGDPPFAPSPEDNPRSRMMRSLSTAVPFVAPTTSRFAVGDLVVENSHEMDPALYAHPTPRTTPRPMSSTSPQHSRTAPWERLDTIQVARPDGPDESVAKLRAENAELKERIAAMERQARQSKLNTELKERIAAMERQVAQAATPLAAVATASPASIGTKLRRSKSRSPRKSTERASPVSMRMHRRGSTTGLMAVDRASRPSRDTQRRMSLKSMLGTQGDIHMTKVEDMVSLLTSISSARDASQLVSILLHGIINMGAPDCSSCHLWVADLEQTFSADADDDIHEHEGVFSRFMSELVDEPEKTKLNVSQESFGVLSSSTTGVAMPADSLDLEDGPQAVLAITVMDGDKNLLGVLEVRNAGILGAARDFDERDEELLLPVASQTGVTLSNLIYSDRLAATLQSADFSSDDLGLLTSQILSAGLELFGAAAALLVLPDAGTSDSKALKLTISSGKAEKSQSQIVARSSTVGVVFSTQMASWIEDVEAHPQHSRLQQEFFISEYCGTDSQVKLMLHPVIAAGHSVGVFGTLHTNDLDAAEQEERMIDFTGQISILINNCTMFEKAKVEQAKIKTKIALLEQLKSIGSEMRDETSEKMALRIIEWTREVLDCDKGRLFMKDPKRNVMWGTEGGIYSQFSLADSTSSLQGWVANNCKPLRVSDAYVDPRFNRAEDVRLQYHTHSVLAVPMLNQMKELTGVIMMVNKRDGEFTADDEELLDTIASQTGVTVSNAQMYDVARKDQNNFNVMLEVSKKLSSELELTALIKNITSSARKLLDCERGSLFLVSDDRKSLFTKVAEGLENRGKIKEIRLPIGMGIVGACVTNNMVINIPDAYEDPRFDRAFDQKSGFRTKSILAVPICAADGTVVGVAQMLNKNGREGIFDVGDENLLKAFGSQAAVSLENSRLFEQAVNSRNFLQNVLRSVKNLVVAFDEKGYVTTFNHSIERYFGVTGKHISQQKFSTWLADYPELVSDIIECMEDEREVEGLPIEVKNSAGETFEMSYTVSPLTFAVKGDEAAQSAGSLAGARNVALAATPRVRTGSADRDTRQPAVQVRGCVLVFDDMTEKKMMKATLGRYLNPALVAEVLKSGSDTLGGVRQKVTVLFSDIRSFTSISERMDASDLVAMLNEYFTWEIPPIFDNQGVLDKFIGDAIMAVFGVPFVSEDGGATDARRSCRAALQMVKQLSKFNHRRMQRGETETFKIGLGLNTGKVISGNIGSEKRMEYTVIGDHVNLASRLEGITKTYGVQIVISEYTQREVHEFFDTRELDSVAVKGQAKGIRIYELLREKADVVPFDAPGAQGSPVGGPPLLSPHASVDCTDWDALVRCTDA